MIYQLLLVSLGGALGGTARFLLSGFVARRFGETFPWGTMVVNVTGAFAIGVAAEVMSNHAMPAVWAFAVTGFLGCYTTVSSLSLQTLALAREGDWLRAGGNLVLSLVLGLTAVALGFAAGGMLVGGGVK